MEKVVCAAVKFTYESSTGGEIEKVVMCLQYDDERVTEQIDDDASYGIVAPTVNGFLTNKNRFVDANEAMVIEVKGGRVTPYYSPVPPFGLRELKIEDLY